ncbi:MAG: STAS domain-containing protein [Lachnospiraceae bacterium]|jgi:SulP family sulfate permease|nr:STAS domain-containing protein [Lachnospiraceae bacterium]MBQ2467940.1 STAS domain-containing protein [Lachnospiraceae bacterium]MBQ2533415.1 STAS domain-containing protein [Lachnospiraceae bacterium]MBQ2578678.1 STAS domain-containing protein [Lachnospiraceae bacterium]MBQ4373104.1 STAS domain-containing protein [Lachnospiraceae bacterium]
MKRDKLKPMLFSNMKQYTKEQFLKDVISGIIVAIIALPLSIALALASGVGPEEGIYTAIFAGFVISLLGGSRVQIAGPTAAFATIVAGIVAKNGMGGLALATVIAGVFLIIMGLCRLGSLIKFIPYTITTGFTAGIAVTIFIGQWKDFLGLTYPAGTVTIETIDKVEAVAANIGTINWMAVLVGLVCLAIQIVWPMIPSKITQKIPGSLLAVIAGIAMVSGLGLHVNTIGDLYEIHPGLPAFRLPDFTIRNVKLVFSDAVTIAVLAAIESLLSCVVADGMINSHHRSNMELIAQGAGNITSALFGGIPATGAIARTAANIKNGGRTPVAGMVHAVLLVLVLVLLMPVAGLIPMPTIASILFLVAYNMCQWRPFVHLCKTAPKSDIAVLVLTFVLTVVFDLVVAIEVGMIIAGILFLKRMSDEADVHGWEYFDEETDTESLSMRSVPKHVRVYEISGPMFFGMTDMISEITVKEFTRVLVIRMRGVPALDASAMKSLEDLYNRCSKAGVKVVFSHVNAQPMKTMEKAGFVEKVGRDNFCAHIDDALERAASL